MVFSPFCSQERTKKHPLGYFPVFRLGMRLDRVDDAGLPAALLMLSFGLGTARVFSAALCHACPAAIRYRQVMTGDFVKERGHSSIWSKTLYLY